MVVEEVDLIALHIMLNEEVVPKVISKTGLDNIELGISSDDKVAITINDQLSPVSLYIPIAYDEDSAYYSVDLGVIEDKVVETILNHYNKSLDKWI